MTETSSESPAQAQENSAAQPGPDDVVFVTIFRKDRDYVNAMKKKGQTREQALHELLCAAFQHIENLLVVNEFGSNYLNVLRQLLNGRLQPQ